jgi:hypothetical protein
MGETSCTMRSLQIEKTGSDALQGEGSCKPTLVNFFFCLHPQIEVAVVLHFATRQAAREEAKCSQRPPSDQTIRSRVISQSKSRLIVEMTDLVK